MVEVGRNRFKSNIMFLTSISYIRGDIIQCKTLSTYNKLLIVLVIEEAKVGPMIVRTWLN